MTTRPRSPACASIDADQSIHSSSSSRRSSRTLLSTSVATLLASGHRHDFVSREAFVAAAAQVRHDHLAAAELLPLLLAQPHAVADDLELHLAVRQQAEPLADGLGNGDLA